jgi:hypothetical protein
MGFRKSIFLPFRVAKQFAQNWSEIAPILVSQNGFADLGL